MEQIKIQIWTHYSQTLPHQTSLNAEGREEVLKETLQANWPLDKGDLGTAGELREHHGHSGCTGAGPWATLQRLKTGGMAARDFPKHRL